MVKKNKRLSCKEKYGLTYRKWIALRAKIMFKQNYKCYGCNEPIGVRRGDKHMHHLDGNPKNSTEFNCVVVCPLDHWFIEGYQLKEYKAEKKSMPLLKWLKINGVKNK